MMLVVVRVLTMVMVGVLAMRTRMRMGRRKRRITTKRTGMAIVIRMMTSALARIRGTVICRFRHLLPLCLRHSGHRSNSKSSCKSWKLSPRPQ